MAIRPILRMGDPRLLEVAEPLSQAEFASPWLEQLIVDLHDTMLANQGAGLAAPQIGVLKQVVIFGGVQSARYPDAELVPYTILCNPVLTPLDNEMTEDWEGCLSVPGLRGKVPRFEHLRYTGRTPSGEPIDRTVSGFHARVVQHECDHLVGRLYPTRMSDMRAFGFTDVLFPAVAVLESD
jgi:peptide deformylase